MSSTSCSLRVEVGSRSMSVLIPQARLWQSWEDYMHFWCQREDFRVLLVELLDGEDPDFSRHLLRIAAAEACAGQ